MRKEPVNQAATSSQDTDRRALFSTEGVYKVDSISRLPPATLTTYSDVLLKIRLDIVHQYADHSNMLDVCCATGQHLMGFVDSMHAGIGLDFSMPYLQKAEIDKKGSGFQNANFICSDAKKMPVQSGCFDIAYSFSSLYVIPNVEEVISEMARVLKIGGKCVLDLGNLYSLNVIVAKAYYRDLGWAQQFPLSLPEMQKMIKAAGLRIIEHRAFQLLPLWDAHRPNWLKPLLLPVWSKLLRIQIGGRMLDEWTSSLPFLKYFAFRHIFICEKL